MRRTATLLCIVSAVTPTVASGAGASPATPDKYRITAAEKAACTFDAMRLCSGAYPDEDLLLVCMRQNRTALSRGCQVVFDAGLKRRHL